MNDIFLKIVPEEFLGEVRGFSPSVMRYAGRIGARTAGDVMLPARERAPGGNRA